MCWKKVDGLISVLDYLTQKYVRVNDLRKLYQYTTWSWLRNEGSC